MFGLFEGKAVEIAVGQVTGFLYPSKEERAAAYELLVEFATRSVTTPLSPLEGSIRDAMTSIYSMFEITRDVLRKHGLGAAKGSGGNLSLALVATRVLNEVFRPTVTRWDPVLSAYEELGKAESPPVDRVEWERGWVHADACRAELVRLRTAARAYADTLARICGRPDLGDAAQAVPSSRPLSRVALEQPSELDDVKAVTRMVGWVGLISGVKTLFAERRANRPGSAKGFPEGESAIPAVRYEAVEGEEFWFDYVADIGDGFDATMAVAWLLGRRELSLPGDRSHELPSPPVSLPRGQLLVMGGDEVYPYASREAYERRTVLPYRHAWEGDGTADLVAIPGNHDWLGGISAFDERFVDTEPADETTKVFADHWAVRQRRRYWHVQLPQRWWLWGIDTGLDNRLCEDQRRYFRAAADQLKGGGHRVIICTPVPMWQLRQKDPDAYAAIRDVFDGLMQEQEASIPVWIAGDSHFFAHYENVEQPPGEDHITAGGGGAFLQPTHNAPERIPLESGSPEYVLTHRWPLPSHSRALAARPKPWRDTQYVGAVLIAALLHFAFGALVGADFGHIDKIAESGQVRWTETVATTMSSWPGWMILVAVIVAGSTSTVVNSRESRLRAAGKKYGLIVGGLLAASLAILNIGTHLAVDAPGWPVLAAAAAVGGLVSTMLFFRLAAWVNGQIKANDTLAFSPAGSNRFKHFVRFRIDQQGDLSCFVIGIDPVGKNWATALRDGAMVPPLDPAGVPRLHYVWGSRFPKFRPPARKVALSISDGEGTDRGRLEQLFENLCRRLIDGGHWLLYGGIPNYGFTEQLAEIEQERHADNPNNRRRLRNYLAPYMTDTGPTKKLGMIPVELSRERDPNEDDDIGQIRDLALMRQTVTEESEIRIVVGGRTSPMAKRDGSPPDPRRSPGVIEEAFVALNANQPLLVVGGFGGCGHLLSEALLDELDPREVKTIADRYKTIEGLESFAEMIQAFNSRTKLRNGLTISENGELLTTTDENTAVTLIMRSIERLATTPHLIT